MHDVAAPLNGLLHHAVVHDVALEQGHVGVGVQPQGLERVAPQAVEHHHLILLHERLAEVSADEAGAAGYQYTLVFDWVHLGAKIPFLPQKERGHELC